MTIKLDPGAKGIAVSGVVLSGPRGTAMVDLILDTGAAYNLISRDTALTLGFDLKSRRRSVPIVTANGIVRAPLVFLKRIAIGDAVATGVAAICHDIPEIVETSGLLGLSFLKNFRTVIDYRTLTLEIA